jgi:hypothetical protein
MALLGNVRAWNCSAQKGPEAPKLRLTGLTGTGDRLIASEIANGVADYVLSSSSNVFASFRSGVSKPSVNQP